jgi:hypothetical protein
MFRIALVLAALSTPAMESSEAYKQFNNGWSIWTLERYCSASRMYAGGDILVIAYDPANNRAILSITDPDATSLKEGEQISLHIMFIVRNELDLGWGERTFQVNKNGDASQMIGFFDGREMLHDFARSDLIGFSIDEDAERLVGSYGLDGSADAMAALKRCSFEMSGLNPNDPFLR